MPSSFSEFLDWEKETRDTIDFKRIYVDMAGDILAGLLLSQLVFWYLPDKKGATKLRVYKQGRWWIAKRHEDWYAEVRLTRRQAQRALKQLVKRGLVVTRRMRFNGSPTTHTSIEQEAFQAAWRECLSNPNRGAIPQEEDDDEGAEIPNAPFGAIQQSSLVQSLTETTNRDYSYFSPLIDTPNDRADTPLDGSVEPSREEIHAFQQGEEGVLDEVSSHSHNPFVADNSHADAIPTVAATSSPYQNPSSPPTKPSVAKQSLGYPKPSAARVKSEAKYVPCDEDGDVLPPKKKRRGRPRTQLGKLPLAEILEGPRRAELFPDMTDDGVVDEIVRLSNWFVKKRMPQLTHQPVVAYGKETVFAQKLFSYYSPIEIVSCFKRHYDDKNGLLNVWWNMQEYLKREFKLPVDPRTLDDWKRWPDHVKDKQLAEYWEQVKESRVPWREE